MVGAARRLATEDTVIKASAVQVINLGDVATFLTCFAIAGLATAELSALLISTSSIDSLEMAWEA